MTEFGGLGRVKPPSKAKIRPSKNYVRLQRIAYSYKNIVEGRREHRVLETDGSV